MKKKIYIISHKDFLSILITTLLMIGTMCTSPNIDNTVSAGTRTHKAIVLTCIHLEQTQKNIDQYFKNLANNNNFNGTVLIARAGKTIYSGAFGYSNLNSRDTMLYYNSFELGSVSKQFTAVCILMLVADQKLTLSDTIQKFFPEFPYTGITIEMLLTHHSGLPNYIYLCDDSITDKNRFLNYQDVINTFIQYSPMPYYRPNVRFDYSNTGYMMLAAIVEKVSGIAFSEFLKNRIFDKLNMKNSFVYSIENLKKYKLATGHIYGTREAEPFFLNTIIGDKGIYSCVEDLYKWDQGLYDSKLLPDSILQLAFKPYIINKRYKQNSNYGFGWRIEHLADSTLLLYHTGWWQGFQSLLVRIPQDRTTIAILKNKKNASGMNKMEILQLIYPLKTMFYQVDSSENTYNDSILMIDSTGSSI